MPYDCISPRPASAEAGVLGKADAVAADDLGTGLGRELLSAVGMPPSPTIAGDPFLEAAATPDTLATPDGLGDGSVGVQHGWDELIFEKRQHELEVSTWSREREEQADALSRQRAQLDARSERLRALEARLASREAEVEVARKELLARDERLAIESNEFVLERERLERREEAAAGLEAQYQKSVENFNSKIAERQEEHRRLMLAELQKGRESYREELRKEFDKKCKIQESRFKEKRNKLEAELESLKRNLGRVRRERDDEKSARKHAVEETERLRRELDSLQAQIAPVVEQAAERRATAS